MSAQDAPKVSGPLTTPPGSASSGPASSGPASSGPASSGPASSGSAPPGPVWSLPRGVIVLVGMAAAVAAVAGAKAFQSILAPLMLALMLTIAAAPLQQWLITKLPRWLATTITLIVVEAVVLGFVIAVVVSIARLATVLPQYAGQAQDLQDQLKSTLASMNVGEEQFQQLVQSLDFGRLLGVVESILTSTLGVVSNLVLIVMLLFFMVFDAAGFPQRAGASAKLRPDLVEAFGRFVRGTQQYLIVSTIFGAIVAVLDTIALYLIGVPLAGLWGLLAFITNYIPNVGFIIGLIPPTILALLSGGWTDAVAVIVVYCLLNLVIQSIIQPRFVGDAVGLSTTLTFVSLIFWGWVLGPLGAILAVPMTLLAKALLVDIDPAAAWAVPFIGSGPPGANEKAAEVQQRIELLDERVATEA